MIEHRLFVSVAQGLPIGTSTKVVHKGCPRTKREALYVANEADAYWCYCHGCGDTGHYQKVMQRIKVKAPEKTGWVPDDLACFGDADMTKLPSLRFLEIDWVAQCFTLLKYSHKTKRIYLPDDSKSYLGMDTTGAANARWYSPRYRKLAMSMRGRIPEIHITAFVDDYLAAVRLNKNAVLCMDKAAEKHALAELSKIELINYKVTYNKRYLSKDFLLNLRALGG